MIGFGGPPFGWASKMNGRISRLAPSIRWRIMLHCMSQNWPDAVVFGVEFRQERKAHEMGAVEASAIASTM
jgi:hypothetical protein